MLQNHVKVTNISFFYTLRLRQYSVDIKILIHIKITILFELIRRIPHQGLWNESI